MNTFEFTEDERITVISWPFFICNLASSFTKSGRKYDLFFKTLNRWIRIGVVWSTAVEDLSLDLGVEEEVAIIYRLVMFHTTCHIPSLQLTTFALYIYSYRYNALLIMQYKQLYYTKKKGRITVASEQCHHYFAPVFH